MEVRGTIESFDVDRGVGVLRSVEDVAFSFHCVNIADGTRSVAVEANVRAQRAVGRLGHDEVTKIETL